MIENNPTLEDSIFRIGKVISVDGRLVRVKVDKTKNTSHLLYKGQLLRNISVGGYIKIVKGFTAIIGKVEGEFVQEDKLYVKAEYGSEATRSRGGSRPVSIASSLHGLGASSGSRS